MLHVEDFIEVYCLSNNKTTRGMAERESATYADIIKEFYNLTKFTTRFTTKLSA